MVLFYDTEPKPKPTGKRKYVYRLIKVTVGLALLTWLSLWVLFSIGGNSSGLKLGVQDYLNETTGYLTQIGTFDKMSFYPQAHMAFKDMTFHKPLQKPVKTPEELAEEKRLRREADPTFPQQKGMADFFDAGDQVAHVGSGLITMDFWDMLLMRRRFQQLEVSNIMVQDSVWLPEALTLDFVKVVPDADFPAIAVEGLYGKHKVDLRIKLAQIKDKRGRTTYELPGETPVKLVIGPINLDGILTSAGGQGLQLEISSLKVGAATLSGHVGVRTRTNEREITLALRSGGSKVTGKLEATPLNIIGTIVAETLDIADISTLRQVYRDVKDTFGLSGDDKVSFYKKPADISLVIQKLERAGNKWGNAKADMKLEPYKLEISNILGLINGGALTGALTIDASSKDKDPNLKLDMKLRGWDYARLQSQVTGQADTHVSLTSAGKTFAALEKNLKGEMLTIGGEGELTRDTVLYWGGGLLNAMLPDLSGTDRLSMNCMVADFDVQGYTGKTKTMFMDLKDLTVVGEGTVDLDDLLLDLTLKPNPKEISILDGGVAVSVTGPLGHPKIEPEAFSVAKKLGGLFLGTINPAFWAFSLTDLGLNDSHPCSAYIKK